MSRHARPRAERGITMVEVLIAIVVLTTGILAVGRMIPAATRGTVTDRMLTQANAYAQEKIESLHPLGWAAPEITDGRHPTTGYEDLGSGGQWKRFYEITTLAAPLDNLRKVTVTVEWNFVTPRSVSATTYLRR